MFFFRISCIHAAVSMTFILPVFYHKAAFLANRPWQGPRQNAYGLNCIYAFIKKSSLSGPKKKVAGKQSVSGLYIPFRVYMAGTGSFRREHSPSQKNGGNFLCSAQSSAWIFRRFYRPDRFLGVVVNPSISQRNCCRVSSSLPAGCAAIGTGSLITFYTAGAIHPLPIPVP